MPKVTVVVAVYNGVTTLARCIDSIVSQQYDNKELIVIDGGSTDGTVDILKAGGRDITYWVSEPDRGIYHAWNKALDHVKGEWICFLGCDDEFYDSNVLKVLAPHLASAYPRYRIVYGKVALQNKRGEPISYVGQPWEDVKGQFRELMAIPHQGVLHHRSLFGERGLFDESFKIAGDYEFLLRELNGNDALFVSDVVVARMQQGGVSSDPRQSLSLLHELREARARHGERRAGLRWHIARLRVRVRLLLWAALGERRAKRALDMARRCLGKPAYWTKI